MQNFVPLTATLIFSW